MLNIIWYLKIMKRESILIIDDDDDFMSLVKFILEQENNWEILTASDGEEGIARAELQQPSLILLDVVMPNLNGLDVYNLLRSNSATYSIPIIFVTAMVRMEKIIKAHVAEDIKVITKPFDLMNLTNQVINECDRYSVANNLVTFNFSN